jgi:hypothetical protein
LSLHDIGQLPSHVSAVSTTLLPQLGEQSGSLFALHPPAQQPSLGPHSVICWCTHDALHVLAAPTRLSIVHATLSTHVVGQSPSQVSPDSVSALPHVGEQSESVFALHPGAQQPSLFVH